MEYIERHQLYEKAMSIWKGTDHYPVGLLLGISMPRPSVFYS